MYDTLISTSALEKLMQEQQIALFDCRFRLGDTLWGRVQYQESHIPDAIYLHLDDDLSAPVIPGQTGRHPLPDAHEFANRLGALGVGNETQVVVYDDLGGAIAGRLWWMLRWLGHEAAAVLDGGWPAWLKEGRPQTDSQTEITSQSFDLRLNEHLSLDAEDVEKWRIDPDYLLIDARGADRYRGENETIDPVAGHIPGAISAPFAQNLDSDGHFLSRDALRQRFLPLNEEWRADRTVVYCGSGVTAAHHILAMLHAGLGEARLYPGSWSEWITDDRRPLARGEHVFGDNPP